MNTSTRTVLTPLGAQAPWRLWVRSVLQFTLARCAVSQVQIVNEIFLTMGPPSSVSPMACSYKGPQLSGC